MNKRQLYTMKILVLATLVVSVIGGPIVETWTMDELEKVLQTEPVDPEQKPYWSEAFNTIMYSLFTNKYLELTQYSLPSPKGVSLWTLEELEKALNDPTTNPKYQKAIIYSFEYLNNTHRIGVKPKNAIEVYVYAMDISTWTLSELNKAIANPGTSSELLTYLETARTKLTSDPEYQNKKTISIVTKVGLVGQKKDLESTATNIVQ